MTLNSHIKLRVVMVRAATQRTLVLRAVTLRAMMQRAVELRPIILHAVMLRPVMLRNVMLRLAMLREAMLRAAVLRGVAQKPLPLSQAGARVGKLPRPSTLMARRNQAGTTSELHRNASELRRNA